MVTFLYGVSNKRLSYALEARAPSIVDRVLCPTENDCERIKSLRDPSKKMSKSSKDPKTRIEVLDEPSIVLERVKKAITDCTSKVTYEPESRPGVSNLITIHSMLTGKTPDQICLEMQGLDTGMYVHGRLCVCSCNRYVFPHLHVLFFFLLLVQHRYKLVLADVIIEELSPIREEFAKLIVEPAYLQQVLRDGTEKATEIATDCWNQVRDKVGFGSDFLRVTDRNVQNVM